MKIPFRTFLRHAYEFAKFVILYKERNRERPDSKDRNQRGAIDEGSIAGDGKELRGPNVP